MIGFLMFMLMWLPVYLVLAGAVYPYVLNAVVAKCPYDKHNAGTYKSGKDAFVEDPLYHRAEAIGYSLAGPFILPFIIGSKISHPFNTVPKVERTRIEEIKAAEHSKKLAKIKLEEEEILTKQLSMKD